MFDGAVHYLTGDWIDAWAGAVIAGLALIVLPLAASEAFSGRMRISERAPAIVCLLGAALMLAGFAWLAYGSHAINFQDRSVSGSFELSQWPLLGGLLIYIVGIAIGVARRELGSAAKWFYGFGFLGAIHSALLVNLTAPWHGILWQHSNGPWKTFAKWGDGGEELGREFWPDFAPIGDAAHWFGVGDVRYAEPSFLMGNIAGALPFIVIGVAVLSGYMYLRRRERVPGAVLAIGAAIPLVAAVFVGLWLDQGWSRSTGPMLGVGISLLAPLALVSASRRRGLGGALGRLPSPASPATELSQPVENWPVKEQQRMQDFLSFRRMITPFIVQVLFWLGAFAAIVVGFVLLIQGEDDEKYVGLAVLVIGPLILRVYAEMLIVFFRINETLTDIRDQGARGSQVQSTLDPHGPGPSVPRAESRTTPEPERRTKNCPYCAESILYEATKCRFCDSDVPNEPGSPQ